MKRKITKRDLGFFFIGLFTMFLIDVIMDWDNNVKAFFGIYSPEPALCRFSSAFSSSFSDFCFSVSCFLVPSNNTNSSSSENWLYTAFTAMLQDENNIL